MLTFLMLINPDIPHNDGILRPITIAIPEGTFLNAKFPAATTFGNSLTGPTSDSIFRALAQVLPETVSAGWNRMISFAITGTDPRHDRPYVDIFFLSSKGGSGAVAKADGYDHIGLINCAGGILAQDYEMFEIQDPHFLVRHEYWPDSAGAGEWRGGLGTECEIAINGESLTGVTFGDGVEDEARAFGLYGGTAGVTNQLHLTQPDGTVRRPKAKEVVRDIPTGSVFVQQAGGGGGYGDPFRRTIRSVADDVRNELISVASARTDYGVVIDPQTFEVDADATKQLRAKP
jgi:N-methylhydantoinase B